MDTNKKDKNTLSVAIPFSGFYCSIWEDFVDYIIESEVDLAINNKPEKDDPEYEAEYPFVDFKNKCVKNYVWDNTCEAYEYIAKKYSELFREFFEKQLNFKFKKYEYDTLWSPREYNFMTDRIYVFMDKEDFFNLLEKIDIEKFSEYTAETCRTKSGFWCYSKYEGGYKKWNIDEVDEVMFSELLNYIHYHQEKYEFSFCEDIEFEIRDAIDDQYYCDLVQILTKKPEEKDK